MRLALFDLDHTLIPIDSDYSWGQFTVQLGWRDAESHTRANDAFYEQYKAGTLDIHEYIRFSVAPLAGLVLFVEGVVGAGVGFGIAPAQADRELPPGVVGIEGQQGVIEIEKCEFQVKVCPVVRPGGRPNVIRFPAST